MALYLHISLLPPKYFYLLLLPQLLLILLRPAATSQSLSKPGCPSKCGNVEIPFPFGTSSDCSRDDNYLVTCNNTYDPPKPFMGNMEFQEISLLGGYAEVLNYIARDCYNKQGTPLNTGIMSSNLGGPFTFNSDRNMFTVIGCDTLAYLVAPGETGFETGCVTICKSLGSVENGTCSGIGCCQTAIPKDLQYFRAEFKTYNNHTSVYQFNPCSYAFLVDQEKFVFNTSLLEADYTYEQVQFPVVVDWFIAGDNCESARANQMSYACRSNNSRCFSTSSTPNEQGYRCNCSSGYQGNPYLDDGCQDINECTNPDVYPCYGVCTNFPGGYNCSCPSDTSGDNPKIEQCIPVPPNPKFPLVLKLVLGLGSSLLFLCIIGFSIYWGFQKKKLMQLKQNFFRQNGGLFLQQEISSQTTMFRIYTMAELEKATNNFHKEEILGRGGYGIVYKGILDDKRVVAIKRSVVVDENRRKEFAREMLILSQLNHKNIVKLLGCCLEVEVPMLVYEYIPNGTLFEYIHKRRHQFIISFHNRLRIATEAAEALAYLHSAASPPILHGDVKSSNILLDENYMAKVADFGTSILAPVDKDKFTTLVQGTCGYLDPEYLQTCKLTEKSDVYSFGVVLVELLTGKKALNFGGSEEERSLALSFISHLNGNRLPEILDRQILNDGISEDLQSISELAVRCLSLKGTDRPTMREVWMTLQALERPNEHPWVDRNLGVSESLMREPSTVDAYDASVCFSEDNPSGVRINHGR